MEEASLGMTASAKVFYCQCPLCFCNRMWVTCTKPWHSFGKKQDTRRELEKHTSDGLSPRERRAVEGHVICLRFTYLVALQG